jgi:hypothetical protein
MHLRLSRASVTGFERIYQLSAGGSSTALSSGGKADHTHLLSEADAVLTYW